MNFRKTGVACAAALLLCAAPAFAETSLGGGIFWSRDGSTYPGLLGSYYVMGVPGYPVKVKVSAAVPFGPGGRYVLSGEGEYQLKRFFAGAGGGFGVLNSIGAHGLLYEYYGGYRITPMTSIQGRYYGSLISSPGAATYLGLAFHLK